MNNHKQKKEINDSRKYIMSFISLWLKKKKRPSTSIASIKEYNMADFLTRAYDTPLDKLRWYLSREMDSSLYKTRMSREKNSYYDIIWYYREPIEDGFIIETPNWHRIAIQDPEGMAYDVSPWDKIAIYVEVIILWSTNAYILQKIQYI